MSTTMMAIPPVFLSAVLSYLIVISESTPTITPIATETSLGNQRNHRLTLELEEAKLKIARLGNYYMYVIALHLQTHTHMYKPV